MATVIERPEDRERVVRVERSSDTGGWLVAVIILVAVIAGLIWWFRYRVPAPSLPQQTADESANINVTIPTGGTPPASGDGGGGGSPPSGQSQ